MYWGKDMQDIYISGTGIWTPPHKVSNQELVESFNTYVELYNAETVSYTHLTLPTILRV